MVGGENDRFSGSSVRDKRARKVRIAVVTDVQIDVVDLQNRSLLDGPGSDVVDAADALDIYVCAAADSIRNAVIFPDAVLANGVAVNVYFLVIVVHERAVLQSRNFRCVNMYRITRIAIEQTILYVSRIICRIEVQAVVVVVLNGRFRHVEMRIIDDVYSITAIVVNVAVSQMSLGV